MSSRQSAALLRLILVLCFLGLVASATPDEAASVTVHAWPVASAKPTPLAVISYNSKSRTATVEKYLPPHIDFGSAGEQRLVRIGLYEQQTQAWSGVVTSARNLDPDRLDISKSLALHVDDSGRVWNVGFGAERLGPGASATKDGLSVTVVVPAPGPTPHLNRPVVLNPDGRIEAPAQGKTFFQK